MTNPIQIAGICERDLDLLLVEELVASSSFREWLTTLAGIPKIRLDDVPLVRRAVTHSSGESDIELHVTLLSGEVAGLLIENKVHAALQPAQADRYRLRGSAYLSDGKCQLVRTMIIAPERYFGSDMSVKGFDAALTYEGILNWYESRPELGARVIYKRSLILGAIEKATLGYQPIADRQMTGFWESYHQWVQQEAAWLNMSQPRGRPAGSTFVFFKPDRLPSSRVLVHKFTHGHVDLEFVGWGDRLSELREALISLLPSGSVLVKVGKSAAVRCQVPPLDAISAKSQQELALVGIREAANLLAWYEQHRAVLAALEESTT